jgi:hypothetical protein
MKIRQRRKGTLAEKRKNENRNEGKMERKRVKNMQWRQNKWETFVGGNNTDLLRDRGYLLRRKKKKEKFSPSSSTRTKQ